MEIIGQNLILEDGESRTFTSYRSEKGSDDLIQMAIVTINGPAILSITGNLGPNDRTLYTMPGMIFEDVS